MDAPGNFTTVKLFPMYTRVIVGFALLFECPRVIDEAMIVQYRKRALESAYSFHELKISVMIMSARTHLHPLLRIPPSFDIAMSSIVMDKVSCILAKLRY